MSLLQEISTSVQKVAEAISIALGLEVEIVDENLTIIGGTGIYKGRIGQKEEAGKLDGQYLYARVLRKGETEQIKDAKTDKGYGLSHVAPEELAEVAEICTPIKLGEKTLGIIGLVAFDNKQKNILLDEGRDMTTFTEKMAELLAAKATQQLAFRHAEFSKKEIMAILEATHEGIIAIDRGGYIKHCNDIVAKLFGTEKDKMTGEHINKYMIGSPALNVFKTGKGYTEREERYRIGRGGIHLIVTAKPFFAKGKIAGVAISLRDIKEAQLLAYKMEKGITKKNLEDIIGESETIKKIKSQALLIARGNAPVLITGERGTGKSFLAGALHYSGSNAEQKFVKINCDKVPASLIGKEIKDSLLKAENGTLFLEEVDALSKKNQEFLLDIIKKLNTDGGEGQSNLNVRIISSSISDLKKIAGEKSFLEELYNILGIIQVKMPSIKERGKEDILSFMEHYLRKYNRLAEENIMGFTDEAKNIYLSYRWPENIKEIEEAVEYGVVMCKKEYIDLEHIPLNIISKYHEEKKRSLKLTEQVKEFEKNVILKELDANGGC